MVRKAQIDARSSIATVAERANVSIGTVSRVMNRHPAVRPELRRKVLLVSRELGFVPKVKHRCVALITGRHSPGLPVGYVSVMSSLVSRLLAAHRLVVELIDIDNLDLAYETHIDAAIGIVFDSRLAELASIPNLPITTLNNPDAVPGAHAVYADHYTPSRQATEYLLARGHRAIGFLAIEPNEWGSAQRLRGYRDALDSHGVPFDPALVQYTLGARVYDILFRWKQRNVSAILNFSEDVGLEVLHILQSVLGLRIGRDVSTISLEDLPIYQYLNPPQTTVRQPLEQLAEEAVGWTKRWIDSSGAAAPGNVCLPSQLIERDSVATLERLD